MRTSESTAAIFPAIIKARHEFPSLVRNQTAKVRTKSGPDYSYTYIDLASLLSAIEPVLFANGLAVVGTEPRIIHESGEWVECDPIEGPRGGDWQAVGSGVSYARRYGILSALGLATEDDDGQGAVRPSPVPAAQVPSDEPAPVSGTPEAPDAPPGDVPTTFDALATRLGGNRSAAKDLLNGANGTTYTAASILKATPAQVAEAWYARSEAGTA